MKILIPSPFKNPPLDLSFPSASFLSSTSYLMPLFNQANKNILKLPFAWIFSFCFSYYYTHTQRKKSNTEVQYQYLVLMFLYHQFWQNLVPVTRSDHDSTIAVLIVYSLWCLFQMWPFISWAANAATHSTQPWHHHTPVSLQNFIFQGLAAKQVCTLTLSWSYIPTLRY